MEGDADVASAVSVARLAVVGPPSATPGGCSCAVSCSALLVLSTTTSSTVSFSGITDGTAVWINANADATA